MAHPAVDADRYRPPRAEIHSPDDIYLPEITTPNPTSPRDANNSRSRVR